MPSAARMGIRRCGPSCRPLNLPNGSREARLGVEIRNALMFNMYGAATGGPPTHQLKLRISTSRLSVLVDPTTARADLENYGINAVYELRDIATDKVVLTGTTFSRVSYDIPGQQQRFARSRALRDAEDQAAKVIADNISQRLASFFIAGT
jgi:LPS-assembly lipoprotein